MMAALSKNSREKTRDETAERRERTNNALALIIVLAAAIILAKWFFFSNPNVVPDFQQGKSFDATILGAVENPGTYEVLEGDTISDLIVLAGGFHEYAERDAVRLGKRLLESSTGTIHVPFTADYVPPPEPPDPGDYEYPININTAGELELQALVGIGPALAKRIVEYREKNGLFQKTAEIMNVNGIGLEKYKDMHGLIVVDE